LREFTSEESERHNALTKQAWALTEGELLIEPVAVRPANWFAKRKLTKALGLFEKALEINPDGWSSLWAMGKIYQRLEEHDQALLCFGKAFQINPQQKDVAREAGLAALDVGNGAEALYFCQTAVELMPDDPGLVANLAWAYVISGNVTQAQTTIRRAVEADPEDEISKAIERVIGEIASGKRPMPKTLVEITRLG
jgi:Flp pilus assembly protein TadD